MSGVTKPSRFRDDCATSHPRASRRPHHRDMTVARNEFAAGRWHVFTRGNNRQEIGRDDIDRIAWVRELAVVTLRHAWFLEAWCLLDNHFHFVVTTQTPNLGIGMWQLNGRHAKRFNMRHGRCDHLFGKRYSAVPVVTEPHLLRLTSYVPLQPVAAGLRGLSEEWRWSG
jgi:REP element-mobilizing transposase RayT